MEMENWRKLVGQDQDLCHMEKLVRRYMKAALTERTLDDLILWLDFPKSAVTSISINRVIFRKPTLITFSN